MMHHPTLHRHTLQHEYWALMAAGEKRVEARRLEAAAAAPGDTIVFTDAATGAELAVRVSAVREYGARPTLAENVREYLTAEAELKPLGGLVAERGIETGVDLIVGLWAVRGAHREAPGGVRAYVVEKTNLADV